jgi:hypothetical protein
LRRRILRPFPWIKEAYRGQGCKGTGFALKPGSPHCISPEVMLWTAPPPAHECHEGWVL